MFGFWFCINRRGLGTRRREGVHRSLRCLRRSLRKIGSMMIRSWRLRLMSPCFVINDAERCFSFSFKFLHWNSFYCSHHCFYGFLICKSKQFECVCLCAGYCFFFILSLACVWLNNIVSFYLSSCFWYIHNILWWTGPHIALNKPTWEEPVRKIIFSHFILQFCYLLIRIGSSPISFN